MTIDPFLQQLLAAPAVEFARLSPDRRWVAFVWYRRHENYDVFLAPCDASAPPLALTHTPEVTWLVSWTPDSRAVIVAEDHEGDERARLFRVDIDRPEVMLPLTEDSPPYFIRGGSLHPDGRSLFFGANYDFNLSQLIEPTWIYRQDLITGIRKPIACPRKPVNMQVELNPQGTHLLYTCKDRHPSGRQVHLVDCDGVEDREILNFGERVKTFARWLPDGERILVISESTGWEAQGYNSLGVYHFSNGEIRWLVDDPGRLIEGAWVSPDGSIVVDEIHHAQHLSSWIDPDTGMETPFPTVPGNLLPLGRASDGAWLAIYYSSIQPAEVVRFMEDARTPDDFISITRGWEQTRLRPDQLTPADSITWAAPDGLEIHGWLYRARTNLERAVVRLHGGPSSHAEDRLKPEIQYLVSRGFHVLDVNYRGSTGFGLPFREAIKQEGWGGREQEDIAAAARALVQMGLARPGQVGVMGTSYGGYSAWCQMTLYASDVIAAAVPICGMTDLRVDYETTRPDLRPLSEEMMGGSPDEIPEKYASRSPINYLQNIRGRLLIVQGARDPNVTPENVRQVRQRLDEQGIPYEILVFEDEGHGISLPVNEAILYPRIADFFDGMDASLK